MRLSQKLILFVLGAAIVPLSFAGFWLLRESERELSARLEREQKALALAAAEGAGWQLGSAIDAVVRSSLLIDWPSASSEEVSGGYRLLLGQSPLVAAVALVDGARSEAPPPGQASGTSPLSEAQVGQLGNSSPVAALSGYTERGVVALGQAQDGPKGAWIPIAVQVGTHGDGGVVLVAALDLQPVALALKARAPEGVDLELVDGDGRVVASSALAKGLQPLAAARLEVLRSGQPLAMSSALEQVAVAPVPEKLGLSAVVAVPREVARAPVKRLEKTALGGMGVTAALLAITALLFARGLVRRLEKVAGVATAFARGELSTRLDVGGEDELSELATTFNSMGTELEAARVRLTRWNDDLKQKVDEATADLRAAQAQLVEAQKLAAIGQLGAGVAHEINNPLVGILGNAQLLLMDRPEGDADFSILKQIEDNAKRCRDITQNLLKFSQTRGEVSLRPIDLNGAVKAALAFEQPRHEAAQVEVRLQLAPGEVRIDGDPEQLGQVISQLCSNARTAMAKSEKKQIVVTTRLEPTEALLTFEDTGKGISPANLERIFEPFFTTKDVWSNIGLGLSLAYRIVQEHHGRIETHSEPGKGTRFTIHLCREGSVARAPKASSDTPLEVGGVGSGIMK